MQQQAITPKRKRAGIGRQDVPVLHDFVDERANHGALFLIYQYDRFVSHHLVDAAVDGSGKCGKGCQPFFGVPGVGMMEVRRNQDSFSLVQNIFRPLNPDGPASLFRL